MARYEAISPLKALASNSAGTALIEAFCDYLCENLNERFNELGFESRPRFSAGYGDFPLQCQIELLKMLKADKLLGITLNDSLLMTPAKSVTAVIGLKKRDISLAYGGCKPKCRSGGGYMNILEGFENQFIFLTAAWGRCCKIAGWSRGTA